MNLEEIFPKVVGQHSAKEQLGFYLAGYLATGVLPNLLLAAEKGGGKTLLARSLGKHLRAPSNPAVHKKFLELNCSTIVNEEQFFDSFILPRVVDQEVTVFFDECSELPVKVQMALLSITETNVEKRTRYFWNGAYLDFDFRKVSFIFATTETQRMFHALRNRLERVEFDKYSNQELGDIARRAIAPNVKIETGLLDRVAVCCRGNAREAFRMGDKINTYLLTCQKNNFTGEDWNEMKRKLRIYPYGLSTLEVQALTFLRNREQTPLKQLSSKLGMTPESVQRDIELQLVKSDLIEIKARGRALTERGHRYITELEHKGMLPQC